MSSLFVDGVRKTERMLNYLEWEQRKYNVEETLKQTTLLL